VKKIISYFFGFLAMGACVDRISFDTGRLDDMPLVIDGYISDQPGPYTVRVSSSFDIDAKVSTRIAEEVKRMVISDNSQTIRAKYSRPDLLEENAIGVLSAINIVNGESPRPVENASALMISFYHQCEIQPVIIGDPILVAIGEGGYGDIIDGKG
jgi:hypothetical protein